VLGPDDGVGVELLGLVDFAREVPDIFDLVVIDEEVFGHLNLLINLGINGENPNVVTQTGRGSLRLKSLLRYMLGQLLLEVTKHLFNWCYWNNIGTTSRKAPAFLQGLLQFELRLVGGGGLEPPTPCL